MSWRTDADGADDDYDEFDDEGSDAENGEYDDEPTIACPYCGEEIYEGGNWCPDCGNYLSKEDSPRPRPASWVVAGIVACLVIVVWWIFLG